MSRLMGGQGLFATWLTLTVAGVAVYFLLSGLDYLVVYILARRRFHPTYVPDRVMNRRAMRLAVVGLVGNLTMSMPIQALIAGGYSRIYWSPSGRSVWWLLASVPLYIATVDTWIYWTHRGLHSRWFYPRTHRYHHQWRVPNSWTSMAFHPFDSFVFALPVHLFGFVAPLHGLVYLAMQGTMTFWSVASHDRVALFKWKWFNYVDNHTLHHWYFRCNYGQFFTFWDRVMGTWRNPVEETHLGRVPSGVLR